MKSDNIKFILFISTFTFINTSVFSQSELLKSRINVRIGSSLINSQENEASSESSPMLYGSLSYTINEICELGLYYGSGKMKHKLNLTYNELTKMYEWVSLDGKASYRSSSSNFLTESLHVRYGLTSEVHLMPLFNVQKSRFDVYIQPQAGIIKEYYEVLRDYKEYIWSEPYVEYGFGIGLRYRFSKVIGIFSDISIGNYYNQDKVKLKAGVALTL
jgi:hypothetical protein